MHQEGHEHLADSVPGSSDWFRVCVRPAAETGPPLGSLRCAGSGEVSGPEKRSLPFLQIGHGREEEDL